MYRALVRIATLLLLAMPLLGQVPAAPAPPRRTYQEDRVRVRVFRMSGSYLGVEPHDLTADRVAALKLKSDKGVEITMVDRDSPAGKAGLKEHDVIVSFNSTPVDNAEGLRRLIRDTAPEKTVALGILRDGQPLTVNVTLADRSKVFAARGFPNLKMPPMPNIRIAPMPDMPDMPAIMMQYVGRNGILVEDLTSQLGEFFGAKNGGVLVRSVEKGGPGEGAGLKAGDVIVRVGTDRVSDMGDWRRLIRGHQGETVQLGIVRERREMNVSLAIPARREASGGSSELHLPGLNFDMHALQAELERMRPEIERATQAYTAQLQSYLTLHQKEIEQLNQQKMQELQRYMREHQKDMENLQKEMQKMREQLLKQFQGWRFDEEI